MKIKKTNKNSTFKKYLIIYIIILSIVSFTFIMYVLNTLYQYEASFTDNYMTEVVQDITKYAKKGKATKACSVENTNVNSLDTNKESYNDALKQIFKTSNISFTKSSESTEKEPVYNICANNEKIMTVKLEEKKHSKRLGLFSYPVWKVKECNLNSKRGLYYYDIAVPSNYTVEVNGQKLNEDYVAKTVTNESYEELAKYAELPNLIYYELNNFVTQPHIKIIDNNGNSVNYKEENHKIEIENNYIKANTYDEIKDKLASDIDILEIAQNWSLFLTNDLKGTTHGFSTLRKNLIKDSSFYNMAYAWATSIDITFVSSHTLKNPTFTNTSVSDFVVYNENAFSCVVNLEKNMRIANGNEKIDKMRDRMYFVYYDDVNDNINGPTWKLVDMKSITEK